MRGGGLERHFGGVHRVVAAIVQLRLSRRPSDSPPARRAPCTRAAPSQPEGMKLRGTTPPTTASSNTMSVEPSVTGTELDPHVAELPVTAGLLLVAALHLHGLANRLAVRNLRVFQHAVRAELARQLAADNIKVHFALTGEQRLRRFGGLCSSVTDGSSSIRRLEAGEHLVFLALLGGVNSLRNAGRRVLQLGGLNNGVRRRRTERVAGGRVLQASP